MTILSVLLLAAAVVLVLIGQILKRRQVEASWQLQEKLSDAAKKDPDGDGDSARDSDWDAMWDEADAQIDEDFYHLLATTSNVFRGIAVLLAIGAVAVFVISRF